MLLKNDIISFKVWFQNNDGKIERHMFKSFAAAAGHAEAIRTQIKGSVWIDVNASNQDGSSQYSTSLIIYRHRTNTREVLKPELAKQLAEMGA